MAGLRAGLHNVAATLWTLPPRDLIAAPCGHDRLVPNDRVTLSTMSTVTRPGRHRPTVKLRDDRQHAELTRVAGQLAAEEGRRYTLADAVERLLDFWRAAGTARNQQTGNQ